MKVETASLIMATLLLLSVGLAGAWASEGVEPPVKPTHAKHGDIVADHFKEKARKAIERAQDLIGKARELVAKAEETGIDISDYRDLLEEAEKKLAEAEKLLEEGEAEEAFSTAMSAQAVARIIVEAVKKLLGAVAVEGGTAEELKKVLEELEEKLDELVEKARELGYSSEALDELVDYAEKLLEDAWNTVSQNLEATQMIVEELKDVLAEIEELIKGFTATTTTTETSAETTAPTTTTSVKTTVKGSETYFEETSTTTATTAPPATTTAETAETTTEEEAAETGETEVKVEVSGGDQEVKVVVEQVERKIRYENGTTLIIREKVTVVGNRTIVTLSKELVVERDGGEVKPINKVSLEQNQSLVGAVIKVKAIKPQLIKIDQSLSVKVLEVKKNRLSIRLEAPDGTPGRLFVLELSPDTIDLQNLLGFKLTVNGEEAVLASSLLDLASGVYDEPAYVYIISAEGAQILLYIPHFSEYLVEVTGIIQQAAEALAQTMKQILNTPTLTLATITATIILVAAAAITASQRRLLRRI